MPCPDNAEAARIRVGPLRNRPDELERAIAGAGRSLRATEQARNGETQARRMKEAQRKTARTKQRHLKTHARRQEQGAPPGGAPLQWALP